MLQGEEFGSDSSDEDYKPGGESDVSEEEGEGDAEDALTDVATSNTKQKGKRQKKQAGNVRKKKMLVLEGDEEGAAPEADAENEELGKEVEEEKLRKKQEEEKKKADDLFADFMKDVGRPKPRAKPAAGGGLGSLMSAASQKHGSASGAASGAAPAPAQPAKVTVTKVFDFAGETVTVTKDVDAGSLEAKQAAAPATGSSKPASKVAAPLRRGGMASLVSSLGKAPKMSVLEKSRLDWNGFKQENNLDDELQQHGRSKNSYLGKQEFLQRADERQFQLEKGLRDRHRTPR